MMPRETRRRPALGGNEPGPQNIADDVGQDKNLGQAVKLDGTLDLAEKAVEAILSHLPAEIARDVRSRRLAASVEAIRTQLGNLDPLHCSHFELAAVEFIFGGDVERRLP